MKYRAIIFVILSVLVVVVSCKKDEPQPDPDPQNITPKILSLTTSHDTIMFGGNNPATLICEAEGGELTYNWTVDLGDFFPLNVDNSQMEYTASDCCIGNKTIYCTVSNDIGTLTDSVMIYIKFE